MTRRTPRSYTYRIPLDDRKALRKIRVLDRLHDDYWIHEIHKSNVPNGKALRHWACVFYESTEHFDYDRNEMVGGAIPELHKYRYSLEWEPTPESELLEMRHANGGGTRIKGERYVGTSDPRLPNYVPIDTVVPWTPGEIKAMYEGKSVPDRKHYSHDPPEIEADEALEQFREELYWAERDGLEQVEEQLNKHIENCDHKVVQISGRGYGDVAFCEDCGRSWDKADFEAERDSLKVVGTA